VYTISHIFSHILPFLYFGVLTVYYLIFVQRHKALERTTRILIPSLLLFHLSEIIIRLIALGAMPFSTAFDALSFMAFSLTLVYFIIESSFEHRTSGLFIMPLPFLLVAISAFSHNWEAETNPLLANPMFVLHAVLNVLGYTAFAISALYALMYIIQMRNMKQRRFNLLFDRLLPLDTLEKMSIRAVLIGIIVLGVGLLLSHWHLYVMFGSLWKNDIKVVSTDIIWLIYVSGFIYTQRWRVSGRYMAYVSLFGFILLIGAGIVLAAITESFHQFF
jgi:ABC-type uncharacterized transport system permease subunit